MFRICASYLRQLEFEVFKCATVARVNLDWRFRRCAHVVGNGPEIDETEYAQVSTVGKMEVNNGQCG